MNLIISNNNVTSTCEAKPRYTVLQNTILYINRFF